MKKKLLFRLCCVAAIFVLGTASFLSYERLIRYEAYSVKTDNATKESDIASCSKPSELPLSEYYVLRTDGTSLLVYDDAERLICKQPFARSMLSENDKKELERDGLRLTSRSDVLEMLSYLSS